MYSDKNVIADKITRALGIEYMLEKAAWKLSGCKNYMKVPIVNNMMKTYRYGQIYEIFDLLSIVAIIISLITFLTSVIL